MKLEFLGHSTFVVEIGGKRIIFDPFISGNPVAKDVDIENISVDLILLSHGHGDHIADTETITQNNPDATLVSNYEIATHYGKKGIKSHPLNQGGHKVFGDLTIKYVSAIHSSSFPNGEYAGNPGGFVIWTESECLYFSGDTSLTMDMKLIPMLCPPIDVAILCMGDNFTMGFKEAALAAKFVEAKHVVGCHYNTFPPIELDKDKVKDHFEKSGISLFLPDPGQTINF